MCVGSVPVSRTFTASDRRGPGTAWTCDTGVTCRVEREFSRLPRMTRQLRLEILMRGCLSGVIPRAGRHWPGSGGRGIGRSRAETAPARASQRGRAARSGLAAGGRARTCPPWAADLSARWPVRAAPQPPTAQQAGPRRPGRKGRCGRRPSARGGRHRGDWAGVAVVDSGAAFRMRRSCRAGWRGTGHERRRHRRARRGQQRWRGRLRRPRSLLGGSGPSGAGGLSRTLDP